MIQATELRIGNWVKHADNGLWIPEYVGKPVQVDIDIFTTIATLHPTSAAYYEPVPLTPEILEKAGFTKDNDNAPFYDLGKMSITRLQPITTIYWNSWKIIEGDVKYLHQLQNLYFSLTGSELTIQL